MYYLKCVFTFVLVVPLVICDETPAASFRIIGGSNAYPGEFPYQASLRRNFWHFCGGTIIGAFHILTAAHCVYKLVAPYNDIIVVTGTNSLSQYGMAYKIRRVSVHPRFIALLAYSWRNDIAVLSVNGPIDFSQPFYQSPVSLPTSDIQEGSQGVTSGWGVLSPYSKVPSVYLQKLYTTLYSAPSCQSRFGIPVYNDQVCTMQQPGKGTCFGDSGGPLVVNKQVVGVSSFVLNSASCGDPDIFTKVFAYRDFILGAMNY